MSTIKVYGEDHTYILSEGTPCLPIGDPYGESKLKAELKAGMTGDKYWTEAWNKYNANPEDAESRSVVENRLTSFFKKLMCMPEFQMA